MPVVQPGETGYYSGAYDLGVQKALGTIPNLTSNQIDTGMKSYNAAVQTQQDKFVKANTPVASTTDNYPAIPELDVPESPIHYKDISDVAHTQFNTNDIFNALWRQSGRSLSSMMGDMMMPPSTSMDPNFSPSQWTKAHGLTQYDGAFGSARNEQEALRIKASLGQSIQDQRLLSKRLPEQETK